MNSKVPYWLQDMLYLYICTVLTLSLVKKRKKKYEIYQKMVIYFGGILSESQTRTTNYLHHLAKICMYI